VEAVAQEAAACGVEDVCPALIAIRVRNLGHDPEASIKTMTARFLIGPYRAVWAY
jgi:hypothetical protein